MRQNFSVQLIYEILSSLAHEFLREHFLVLYFFKLRFDFAFPTGVS